MLTISGKGTLFACVLAVFFQASCTKNGNVFVLLPDPAGKTGEIRITSKGGSQVLREPNQAVEVKSAETAPSIPAPMKDEKIRETFGDALSVLPAPPIHVTLYFKFDSVALTRESRNSLKEVLPSIAEHKSVDVSVVGHTDRVGTREYNYSLGMKRARIVEKIIIREGIDQSFVSVSSHGEDDPLISTGDDIPEPRNRRVEVIVR